MGLAFLSLPVELRFIIYRELLQETIIRIPGPQIDPNALALLLTCRAIHSEASPLVPSTITFSVYCTEHLVYFLSSLSPETLRSLRHIVICGTPWGLYQDYPSMGSFRTYYFASALCAFPGLQLDTLTVRDAYHGPLVMENEWGDSATGKELDRLILKTKGWRELRFWSPSRALLDTFVTDNPGTVLPKVWDEGLKERDGNEASVKILFGREARQYTDAPRVYPTWVIVDDSDSDEETEFVEAETHVIEPMDVKWEGVDEMAPWREDDFVADEVPGQREVLVIARRGMDVDIVEDGTGMDEQTEMKKLLDKFEWDWRKMKRKGALKSGHRDPTAML